jgi:hypothetical protein
MVVVTFDLRDAERIRGDLQSFLGIAPPTQAPSVEVVSSLEEDGYVLHVVRLITEDDILPSLLAVPFGEGPFPAVVVFHQHAGERHLGKSEVFGLIGDPYQAFGPVLARTGFVVLAPDSIAFEDRRPGGREPTPAMTTSFSTTTPSPTASSWATPSCAKYFRTRWPQSQHCILVRT